MVSSWILWRSGTILLTLTSMARHLHMPPPASVWHLNHECLWDLTHPAIPPASESSPHLFCVCRWFCSLEPRVSQFLCMCVKTRRREGLAQCRRILCGTLCARCPSGKSGCGCVWQMCCHYLVSLLNPAPLFIPVYSLLATSTAPPKSCFVITSLWYTPSSPDSVIPP